MARIEQEIAEAESLLVEVPDDEILLRASKQLARPRSGGVSSRSPGCSTAIRSPSVHVTISGTRIATHPRPISLAAPIRIGGRVVGAVAAVHLTDEDSHDLLLALATVLGVAVVALLVASLIAWISVGRLLWPLKEIAATADAISRERDLSLFKRRVLCTEGYDNPNRILLFGLSLGMEMVQRHVLLELRLRSKAKYAMGALHDVQHGLILSLTLM
jgi:hypothetical protein